MADTMTYREGAAALHQMRMDMNANADVSAVLEYAKQTASQRAELLQQQRFADIGASAKSLLENMASPLTSFTENVVASCANMPAELLEYAEPGSVAQIKRYAAIVAGNEKPPRVNTTITN